MSSSVPWTFRDFRVLVLVVILDIAEKIYGAAGWVISHNLYFYTFVLPEMIASSRVDFFIVIQ